MLQRLRGGAVAPGHGAGLLQQRAQLRGHRRLERLAYVTSASEPASELTIRCAALRSRAPSGSTAKSFSTSSRAVMHAMVTERSTTGDTISAPPPSAPPA